MMLNQFRFKISGQESGEVIVDRRIAFFRGETLPKKSQAEPFTGYSVQAIPKLSCRALLHLSAGPSL